MCYCAVVTVLQMHSEEEEDSELVFLCRYDVLSPGEMQRLCFARLFYLQPKYAGVLYWISVMCS